MAVVRYMFSSLPSGNDCVPARFPYKKLDVTSAVWHFILCFLFLSVIYFLKVSNFSAWQGKSSK